MRCGQVGPCFRAASWRQTNRWLSANDPLRLPNRQCLCYHPSYHAAVFGLPDVASQSNIKCPVLPFGCALVANNRNGGHPPFKVVRIRCDALRRGNRGGCPPHRCKVCRGFSCGSMKPTRGGALWLSKKNPFPLLSKRTEASLLGAGIDGTRRPAPNSELARDAA